MDFFRIDGIFNLCSIKKDEGERFWDMKAMGLIIIIASFKEASLLNCIKKC